jgi:hypothetical protein
MGGTSDLSTICCGVGVAYLPFAVVNWMARPPQVEGRAVPDGLCVRMVPARGGRISCTLPADARQPLLPAEVDADLRRVVQSEHRYSPFCSFAPPPGWADALGAWGAPRDVLDKLRMTVPSAA